MVVEEKEEVREFVRNSLVAIADVLVKQHNMTVQAARQFITEMLSVSV